MKAEVRKTRKADAPAMSGGRHSMLNKANKPAEWALFLDGMHVAVLENHGACGWFALNADGLVVGIGSTKQECAARAAARLTRVEVTR